MEQGIAGGLKRRRWKEAGLRTQPREAAKKVALGLAAFAIIAAMLRFTRDRPVTYADPVEHFKYGSTGGERASGIPISLFTMVPDLFARHLPGKGAQTSRLRSGESLSHQSAAANGNPLIKRGNACFIRSNYHSFAAFGGRS